MDITFDDNHIMVMHDHELLDLAPYVLATFVEQVVICTTSFWVVNGFDIDDAMLIHVHNASIGGTWVNRYDTRHDLRCLPGFFV